MPWAVFCPRFGGAVYLFNVIKIEVPHTYEDEKYISNRNEKAARIWLDFHIKECNQSKTFHQVLPVLDPYEMGGS